MSPYTPFWLAWGAAGFTVEAIAYLRGGYAATLTGHLTAQMAAHPWVAVAVPTVLVGFAIHLLWDALRLR